MVSVLDPAAGLAESYPVAGEVDDGRAQAPNHGADTIVDGRKAIDHTPVVLGVAMIVGDATGADLPVVAHPDELGVEREEPGVCSGGGRGLVVGEHEREVGGGASVGGQDEVSAARDCVTSSEDGVAGRRVVIGDLAAQAELEQERSFVHAERISRRVVACAHMRNLGTGTIVFAAKPVRGVWRMLQSPDDVLGLMEIGAEGVIAGVQDAGATFLAPIFDELTAVVCMSGTPSSHIGIVSREYRVPCLMATDLVGGMPEDGAIVEVDCSDDVGVVRAAG